MLKAGAELGFSPSSRSRVQVAPDPRDGPFAALRRKFDDPFNPGPKPWGYTGRNDEREPDEFFGD